jgi:hypothetical protein
MPGQEETAASQGSEEGSEGEPDMGDPADGSSSEQGDMAEAGAASDVMPDLSDEETLEEALEQFENEMEEAAAEAGEAAGQGQAGGSEGEQQPGEAGGGSSGQEQTAGGGSQGQQQPGGGGASGAEQVGQGGMPGGAQGGQMPPGGQPGGQYPGGSQGTMTRAEQVAILDGQLEASTGTFDDLILQEREHQRRTSKNAPGQGEDTEAEPDYGYGGASGEAPPMRGSGGGGSGGGPIPRSGAEGDFPQQAATFPAPKDIPSGDDDDVVARQLREAAMREPDPQLREKLWDEYRKYKGIEK